MSNYYFNTKIREINQQFKELTRGNYNNAKGTALYTAQVEMAWCIHEVQKGPAFGAPLQIAKAERLVKNYQDSLTKKA
jgi:hypothetical protein